MVRTEWRLFYCEFKLPGLGATIADAVMRDGGQHLVDHSTTGFQPSLR